MCGISDVFTYHFGFTFVNLITAIGRNFCVVFIICGKFFLIELKLICNINCNTFSGIRQRNQVFVAVNIFYCKFSNAMTALKVEQLSWTEKLLHVPCLSELKTGQFLQQTEICRKKYFNLLFNFICDSLNSTFSRTE